MDLWYTAVLEANHGRPRVRIPHERLSPEEFDRILADAMVADGAPLAAGESAQRAIPSWFPERVWYDIYARAVALYLDSSRSDGWKPHVDEAIMIFRRGKAGHTWPKCSAHTKYFYLIFLLTKVALLGALSGCA
jgi:hypothetical protein